MRRTSILSAILVLIVFCGSVCAFDGNRKGFVLGGGLGVAPLASWDSNIEGFNESKVALGANFFIADQVVLAINVTPNVDPSTT